MSYLRTSSRAQDEENSQDRQQYHTRLKGEQLGLEIVREFSDVGSGLDSEVLPGFMAMREFVKDPQNRISNLIIDDLSRLTRDSVLPLQLLQELRKEGVAVYSYEEGLVNIRQMDVLVRVKSWQNNELSRSTSVLTKGGLRAAVRRGLNPASTAAFGYEREAVKYGKEVHYKWVPAEGAAQIVKRIFDRYDQGFRIMEFVEELNKEKVPAPRVALWQTSTVRRILKNKAYAGYIIIGKNPSTRFDDGDDYLEDEDRQDDTYIESPNGHEPLITEELYDRVQWRMAANNRTGPDEATEPGLASPRSTASPNPLSELLKCGLCGSNMVVANQSTGKKLMCSRKKNSGVAQCNKRDVPLFQTLELITDELCQQVITEEAIAEQIEILREIAPDVLRQEEKRRKDINARLSQVQGEKKNLMDLAKLYGTQDLTLSDTLMTELRDLLGEEERLNSESFNISEETKEQEAFLTNPEEVAKIARELGTYLYSEDKAATREFLRLFIRRVDLFEGHGKIEYSLPLPDTCSKQCKHESHVGTLDHSVLLQHASPPPGGIPPFSSGLEPQPLNVLVMDLRRHMEQHKVTSAAIGAVTLGSDKAEFINQLASLLGQNCKATVSYQLRRGEDFSFAVNGMDITEWSAVMSRIAPMLERIKDSSTMGASVTINGDDNSPEQIDSILDQLPGSHVAGMESTFKQKPGE